MNKKYFNLESLIVYYFLLTLYFGKPFIKLTFIPNSNFYLITIFLIFLLSKYSYYLLLLLKKQKSLKTSEYLFFLPLGYLVINFLFLESYSFEILKKYMIILSFSLIFLIYNNRELIFKILESTISRHNSKGHVLALLLLIETILAKSGTYGLIFWSTPFISQNVFNFKPQRIFLAILFTYLFFKSSKNFLFSFLLIFNVSLIVTYSRVVLVMFILSCLLLVLINKSIRKVMVTLFLVFILIFSGFVDIIGMNLNQYLVDAEGKEFIAIVCAEHLDDGVTVNKDALKNNYLKRNVDYGEYPTLPRYFSASNILTTFNTQSIPNIFNKGRENICIDYFKLLNINNSNIESCNSDKAGNCIVLNKNQSLYNSNAQSKQLDGNLEFRINLWSNTLSKISKSSTTLFFGIGVDKSLPQAVDPGTNYGNLWHAHGTIFSILGFFGIVGIFIYLLCLLYIILKKEEFNLPFLILFLNIILLSFSDGVIETPDLSFVFVFITGLLKR